MSDTNLEGPHYYRNREVEELEARIADLSTENHELRAACEARADERDAEMERTADLSKRLAEQQHDLYLCNEENDSFEANVKDLEKRLADMEVQLASADDRDVEWQHYADAETKRRKELERRLVEVEAALRSWLEFCSPKHFHHGVWGGIGERWRATKAVLESVKPETNK